MANLLSLSDEFPHLNNGDCDILVSSFFWESLMKMASKAMALSNGRSESPVGLFKNPFTLWKPKLNRGSTIYIFQKSHCHFSRRLNEKTTRLGPQQSNITPISNCIQFFRLVVKSVCPIRSFYSMGWPYIHKATYSLCEIYFYWVT